MGCKLAISGEKKYFLQAVLCFSVKRDLCIPQIKAAHQPTPEIRSTPNTDFVLPEVGRVEVIALLNMFEKCIPLHHLLITRRGAEKVNISLKSYNNSSFIPKIFIYAITVKLLI